MANPLRQWLAKSELYSFNVVRRDRWIAEQAALLPAGTAVLDVGAGSCPYRTLFAHCRYQTQDLLPLRHEQLRDGAYGEIDYVCDAAKIPVPDASFGAVLCTEVLEHHPEPIAVVKELGRILRPGGRLILTAPLGSGIHQEPYHFYGGYTPWWYERFLTEAGFEAITIEPNEGSFRFFAQEAIRFVQASNPLNPVFPILLRLLWAPFWVAVTPFIAGLLPILCKVFDRFDAERRFTVGYHVTATKAICSVTPSSQ